MKRTLTMSLMLIALMSANSLMVARVPAQTSATAGEQILADESLFTQASLAGFNLDVLRSDSVKTYYPLPEMLRPTIGAIRLRYGQADAEVIEKILVSDDREIDGNAPELIWRELTVHYYGRVGFAVEADGDERAVLFVTNRSAPIFAESLFPQAGSWSRLTSGTANELRSVHFVNENEGWTAGANATLLRTTDGGANWTAVTIAGANPTRDFIRLRFLNQSVGWVGGTGTITRTTNGGNSWTTAPFTSSGLLVSNPTFDNFFPVSSTNVWAVGRGTIGGPAIFLVQYIMDNNGQLSRAFNAAVTVNLTVADMHFFPEGFGFMVGGFAVALVDTSIASVVRFQSSDTINQRLNGIHMLDGRNGWAVGDNGAVFKMTNGDGVWRPQNSGTTANLRDIHFVDANNGWAVGDGGTIVSTSNGGTTWTTEPSGVSADLRGVYAPSVNAVFATGTNGTILKRGAAADSDFSLSFDPPVTTAQRGTKGRSTLMINRTGGFAGNVTIITPDASGIGVKVKPGEASTTDASLGFKFKVKEIATVGSHELTFTGMDDTGRSRSAKVTLVIQ